jgi:hypothetical protein
VLARALRLWLIGNSISSTRIEWFRTIDELKIKTGSGMRVDRVPRNGNIPQVSSYQASLSIAVSAGLVAMPPCLLERRWIRRAQTFFGSAPGVPARNGRQARLGAPKLHQSDSAAFDGSDHLHPNDAAYMAMANSIDRQLFKLGDDICAGCNRRSGPTLRQANRS